MYPPGVGFATGVIVGAAIWGNCNWGGNNVNINVNQYNSFNKTNIQNTNFQHNADHRKGVSYGNQAAAQKDAQGRRERAVRAGARGLWGREQAGAASQQGATAKAQGASAQQGARAGGGESAARSPSASTAAAGARGRRRRRLHRRGIGRFDAGGERTRRGEPRWRRETLMKATPMMAALLAGLAIALSSGAAPSEERKAPPGREGRRRKPPSSGHSRRPRIAVKALVEAVRAGDVEGMVAVIGPK